MRSIAPLLVTTLALTTLVACPRDEHDASHDTGLHSQQGGLPTPTPSEPEQVVDAPKPEPEPTPEPPPSPEVEEELAARKAALADVGTRAFEALKAGEFAKLRELTPLDEGPVREACPDLPRGDPTELEAKFMYCHRTIDWTAIAEAQVFAGKPTGEPAAGCEAGIEDYGRLQLFLHMQDANKTIWRVDFYGAVGSEGKALGIDGSLGCKQVDEAPSL
ncbi:hypothetical protein ACNOYE_15015 [Nannocystaceae bacterium ST9]